MHDAGMACWWGRPWEEDTSCAVSPEAFLQHSFALHLVIVRLGSVECDTCGSGGHRQGGDDPITLGVGDDVWEKHLTFGDMICKAMGMR